MEERYCKAGKSCSVFVFRACEAVRINGSPVYKRVQIPCPPAAALGAAAPPPAARRGPSGVPPVFSRKHLKIKQGNKKEIKTK